MSIYVLSLSDWEDYKPYWFDCDCSKEEFGKAVEGAIDFAIHFLVDIKKEDGFIDGYDLLDVVVPRLQEFNGYKLISPDHEVRIHGMCYYRDDKHDREDKPNVFSNEAWDKVVQHNEKITEEMYKEYEEKNASNSHNICSSS